MDRATTGKPASVATGPIGRRGRPRPQFIESNPPARISRTSIFNELRLWAYRHADKYGDELTFIEALTDQAHHLNDGALYGQTPQHLDDLAAKVALWTWQNLVLNPDPCRE